MSTAYVQHKVALKNTTGPNNVSFDSAPTEGNLLICQVRGSANTITFSASGFTELVSWNVGLTYNFTNTILAKIAGAGESADVAVSASGAFNHSILISEWSSTTGWPAVGSILDTSATATNNDDIPSVTPTAGKALLLLHHASYWDSVTTPTWPAGYTNRYAGSPGSDLGIALASQDVASASGSYGGSATVTTWSPAGAQLALLVTEGGGGGGGARSQAVIIA